MQSLLDFVAANFAAIVFGGLSALAIWGISKLKIEDSAKEAVSALVQRVCDKFEPLVKASMAADSDGGRKITAAEMSTLRQAVWELVQAEAKGPVGALLRYWGEAYVKGLAGQVLAKMGVKVGA